MRLTFLAFSLTVFLGISGFAQQKLPSVIEITGSENAELSATKLLDVCKRQHIPVASVYRWKNHLIIYSVFLDTRSLLRQLQATFPGMEVKFYGKPFYEFNRRMCSNSSVAKAWDNVIISANLVKDSVMQQEYLKYHANQFKEWPEVAQGFCNASFQQLLVFRSGRQLMLVISIPKGASLDELNPKTTENNPRVDDWNALMKKYQEGLPGTKNGETWVFLNPVIK